MYLIFFQRENHDYKLLHKKYVNFTVAEIKVATIR